jgi:hypothetical protein
VRGGFYFHPSDEDLSLGTPEMKKPLERMLSVYIHSENAIGADGSVFFSLRLSPAYLAPPTIDINDNGANRPKVGSAKIYSRAVLSARKEQKI